MVIEVILRQRLILLRLSETFNRTEEIVIVEIEGFRGNTFRQRVFSGYLLFPFYLRYFNLNKSFEFLTKTNLSDKERKDFVSSRFSVCLFVRPTS